MRWSRWAAVLMMAAGCGGRVPQDGSLRQAMREAHAMSEPVTLERRNGDVRETLAYLARRGRLSIVIAPSVQGSANLWLSDTPVRDALTVLLQCHRLAYEKTGQVYTILTEAEYLQRHGAKALEPLPGSSPPQPEDAGRSVSVEANPMDVVELIRLLAEQGDLDVILDPDVAGQASVRLEDIPAGQALESIVRTNALAHVRHGSIYHVMTAPAYRARYGRPFAAGGSPGG
jgi:type II secretory pathway component HofQ